MATKVIERPPMISFSRNEIRYVLESTDTSAAGFFVRASISYKRIGSDELVHLKTYTRLPNSDGKTYIYLNGILDSLLEHTLPDPEEFITDGSSALVAFYFSYAEGNAENLDPVLAPDPSAGGINFPARLAVKGGVDPIKYGRNNYFANYFPANKPFFTWQSDRKMVMPNEPVYLSLFLPFRYQPIHGDIHDLTGKRIRITAYDFEGNAYTRDVSDFAFDMKYLYHLNIGPASLDLLTLTGGEKVWKYSIRVQNIDDDTDVISPRTYYIDYRPQYISYDLVWVNSLGGIDSVRVRGNVTRSIIKDVTRVSPGLDVNDWAATVKSAHEQPSSILKTDSFKGDIGYVEDEIEQDPLIDLVISKKVYQYMDSRWIPLQEMQTGLDLRTGGDKIFSFPIEWRLAMSGELYTPFDALLGVAGDTENYNL